MKKRTVRKRLSASPTLTPPAPTRPQAPPPTSLRDLLDRVAWLAASGVRVIEVKEGSSSVRMEIDPAASRMVLAPREGQAQSAVRPGVPEVDLIRERAHAIVQESARAPEPDAQQADPTEATRSPATEGEPDAEQAGDELDLAHLG